jgi:hypothetical protein
VTKQRGALRGADWSTNNRKGSGRARARAPLAACGGVATRCSGEEHRGPLRRAKRGGSAHGLGPPLGEMGKADVGRGDGRQAGVLRLGRHKHLRRRARGYKTEGWRGGRERDCRRRRYTAGLAGAQAVAHAAGVLLGSSELARFKIGTALQPESHGALTFQTAVRLPSCQAPPAQEAGHGAGASKSRLPGDKEGGRKGVALAPPRLLSCCAAPPGALPRRSQRVTAAPALRPPCVQN